MEERSGSWCSVCGRGNRQGPMIYCFQCSDLEPNWANYVLYQNSELGFHVPYPTGWQVIGGLRPDMVFFASPHSAGESGAVAGVLVLEEQQGTGLWRTRPGGVQNYTILEKRRIPLNGNEQEGTEWDVSFTLAGIPVVQRNVYVPGPRSYLLTFTAPASDAEHFDVTFDVMIQHFTIVAEPTR